MFLPSHLSPGLKVLYLFLTPSSVLCLNTKFLTLRTMSTSSVGMGGILRNFQKILSLKLSCLHIMENDWNIEILAFKIIFMREKKWKHINLGCVSRLSLENERANGLWLNLIYLMSNFSGKRLKESWAIKLFKMEWKTEPYSSLISSWFQKGF